MDWMFSSDMARELFKLIGKFVGILAAVLIVVWIVGTFVINKPIDLNWIAIIGFTALAVLLALILDAVRGVRDELRKQNKSS